MASGDASHYRLQAANYALLAEPGNAYRSLEFGLARGLLDEQASRRGGALTPDERRQQASISERLGVLQRRVLQLATERQPSEAQQQDLRALVAERSLLDGRLAELAITVSQREIADIATIQRALSADAALVAWLDVTDNSGQLQEHWGCVVRQAGEPIWERLIGTGRRNEWTKEDGSLPKQLSQALNSRAASATNLDALVNQLHAQRLAPLIKYLSGVKKLFIVPVNEMAGVPVEVLTRDYTVSYIPSGTFLARLKEKERPAGNRILALGDPIFRRADVPPRGEEARPRARRVLRGRSLR